MKILMLLIPLLLLAQCGKINVEVGGIPKKIEVEHSVSLQEVEGYFEATCKEELGSTATPEEITSCTNTKLGNFLLFLEGQKWRN